MTPAPRSRIDRAFDDRLPDPRSLWVRYLPRHWPWARGWALDLGREQLVLHEATESGVGRDGSRFGELDDVAALLDDVLYVPPVGRADEVVRRRLVERLAGEGVPFVLQSSAGAPSAVADGELAASCQEVLWTIDLTAALVRAAASSSRPRVTELPPGFVALVPMVPGLIDRERFETLLEQLGGARGVQLVAADPAPPTRRRLAAFLEREQDYHALFHGSDLDAPGLRARAAGRGFAVSAERPLIGTPERLRTARRLAGELLLVADLIVGLEGDEVAASHFYRAARLIDRSDLDLAALHREGNLGVLDWLEGAARTVVEETLSTGASTARRALEQRL